MQYRESETIELKKSTSELKEAIISLVAMLNKHHKGKIYFGIKYDGTVIGQDVGAKTIRDISKAISDNIEPKIFPEIKEIRIGDKRCVEVVFDGEEIPYFAYGRAYVRVGDEDKKISQKELGKLFQRTKDAFWESEVSDKKLSQISVKAVKRFIAKANKAQRIDFKLVDLRSALNKLGLVKGSSPLRAAEVLFCEQNSVEVQAAVFAGTDKRTFLDINQFKGNLFKLLERSESYIKEHIDWRARMAGREREEIPEIPLRAIVPVQRY